MAESTFTRDHDTMSMPIQQASSINGTDEQDGPSINTGPHVRVRTGLYHEEEREEEKPAYRHDEEDGFIASRVLSSRQLSLASALDDNRSYVATANAKRIKEVGRILSETGVELCTEYETKWKRHLAEQDVSLIDKWIEKLKNAITTVDTVLEYLEYTGHKMLEDVKTHEGVLRGIFNFSELAFQLEIFTFLKLLVRCIDVPEDPYAADRQHIILSFERVERQEAEIVSLIERGGIILTSIIREKNLNSNKALEFDDIMRKATLEINVCKRNLERIEPVIEGLLWKTNVIKWLSRSIRFFGMGLSCSYLYLKYKGNSLSLPTALGGGMLTAFLWLSLFPSRSYQLYDSLRGLQNMNQRLNDKLEDLHVRMKSQKDHKGKVVIEKAMLDV